VRGVVDCGTRFAEICQQAPAIFYGLQEMQVRDDRCASNPYPPGFGKAGLDAGVSYSFVVVINRTWWLPILFDRVLAFVLLLYEPIGTPAGGDRA
jgi:hypothetical protein